MIEFLAFLWKIIRRLLEEELKSTSGKVNLIGGILGIALLAAMFIQDFLTELLNLLLSFFEKPYLPMISEWLIGTGFALVLIYFYFSVNVINKRE